MEHKRKIFGWFGLLGKLGGITNIFMIFLGGIMHPIAHHDFILKASKKLYMARTTDTTLFLNDPKQIAQQRVKPLNAKAKIELEKHKPIKIRFKDNLCLYVANRMGYCFPNMCWIKKSKFQKLYSMTSQKLNKSLDVVKIIKDLRNLNVLAKNSLMT